MFIRRTPSSAPRTVGVRVGLFFLAAGVWLGGLLSGNGTLTGAAAVILLLALLIGLGERLRRPVEPPFDEESEGEPEADDEADR